MNYTIISAAFSFRFFRGIPLTQARIINQSSAVLCLTIPNRLTNLAATKMDASTKVTVVTIKTALPRESCEDIVPLSPRVDMLVLVLCHGCLRFHTAIGVFVYWIIDGRPSSCRFDFEVRGLDRGAECRWCQYISIPLLHHTPLIVSLRFRFPKSLCRMTVALSSGSRRRMAEERECACE